MISPWSNPLPLEEYASNRVVVYFYSGRWVPIMSYGLADAIALHQNARLLGQEIYIFPPDINPNQFSNPSVLPLFQQESIPVKVNESLGQDDDYLIASAI